MSHLETFEQFMQRALHDPRRGYYARRITAVGSRGDFTTAPMLSKLPAQAISLWASQAMKQSGCRDLIEVGPGEGRLARQVQAELPFLQRLRTRLHLVETSAPLAARQKQLLGNRATWHTDLQAALVKCSGRAVIYSNELVDAFPVRRFCKTPSGWQELAVEWQPEGKVREHLLPPAQLPDSTGFSEQHPLGQWIEVHQSYQHWLETWMPSWQAGSMLTIDYGNTAQNLYQRRPMGSLRAYLLQQRLEGPAIYNNVGRQDLTADVNFSDLLQWSAPWTHRSKLMSFREFLAPHAQKNEALLDEQGPGGAFQVLDQSR